MIEARELTPEQIAPALAEAQGWELCKDCIGWYEAWELPGGSVYPTDEYSPLHDAYEFNELTLDPEIHAGMIDVLDEWLSIYDEQIPYRAAIEGTMIPVMWQHNPEYLQDIRLWQLRACVEFLRRRGG